jgi:exopolyphosphatase / guanosine-5'-triphosphate,3'-diphosphate pyrophosphatase
VAINKFTLAFQVLMPDKSRSDVFAAVDLGSNSFHMKIARLVHDEVNEVDRLRERVRLAAGLTEDKTLSDDVLERAMEALLKFGERLRDIPPKQVRAVGTNTLRQVKRPGAILRRAAAALGHHIEIISGQEEARLVYLGVSHALPFAEERRLVVDIGGGSTECIIGEGFDSLRAASLFMGCVSYTQHFFPEGVITAQNMKAAQTAARVELETIEDRFRNLGWDKAYGSSGTIIVVSNIIRDSGFGPGVQRKSLKKLERTMVEAGRISKLALPGLSAERAPVFPGGVAILRSVVDALGVEAMEPSTGALREGVLYDLIGRVRHEDARERAIQRLVEQYRIDTAQADRVERTALAGLKQLRDSWSLGEPEYRQLLTWAARLHEIGLTISYSGYQRHGAYIVANSELPGFSLDDQRFLAALIESHRRKLPRSSLAELTQVDEETALRLAIILRIAVLLNRGRSPRPLPRIGVSGTKKSLSLGFPDGWLDEHPLTTADLEEEQAHLKKVGYDLTFE